MMCRCLEVSTSGFYAWAGRKPGPRAEANVRLMERMRKIHEDSRGIIGAPRMREDLADEGMPASLNRVARLMTKAGLQGWSRRTKRGGQFISDTYQAFLGSHALVCMSAVGHCGDKAACEGFFGMLKRVYQSRYRTRGEARADVFAYLERFHNPRVRRVVARRDREFPALIKPSAETG